VSYLPEQHKALVDEREKRLNHDLSICREVKAVLDSKGWKDTLGPIIDKTIMEVVGGKVGDTWISGKIDRARKDERREYWIGFKQALIELHGKIMFHLQQIPLLEEQLKQLQLSRQERYKVPMVDDTRYRPEE